MATFKEFLDQTPHTASAKMLGEVIADMRLANGLFVGELNGLLKDLFVAQQMGGEKRIQKLDAVETKLYEVLGEITLEQEMGVRTPTEISQMVEMTGVLNQILVHYIFPEITTHRASADKPQNERIEKLPIAARIAGMFLEGSFVEGLPADWKEGGWMKAHPAQLIDAMFRYMNDVILQGDSRAQDRYFKATITGHTLTMPEHSPTFMDIMKSMVAMASIFENEQPAPPNNGGFPNKAEQLKTKALLFINTTVQIQRSFNRGVEVWEDAEDPSHLVKFYNEKENKLSSVDLERLSNMGSEFQADLGERTLGERFLWAQQAYYAMNDPKQVDWALFPGKRRASIVRGAKAKNSLALYPELSATDADSLVKRFLLQEIAGSDSPPYWITHPLTRAQGESLRKFAERKRLRKRAYLSWRLYGQDGTKDDPKPGSLWYRFLHTGHGHAAQRAYLTSQEKAAVSRGWLPEMIAANEYQYRLNANRAEGQTFLKDDRTVPYKGRNITLPVINTNTGPASKHWLTRTLFAGNYRSKLGGSGTSESSPGPLPSIPDFHILIQTADERYSYIPDDEWEGITLRDAIILANTGADFSHLPYTSLIEAVEGQEPWADQIKWGVQLYNRITDKAGLGVDWSGVASFESGSEGSILTLNVRPVVGALGGISRDAYYMLTRDFGKILKTWDTKAEYDLYTRRESVFNSLKNQFFQQNNRQPKPSEMMQLKPAQIDGQPISDTQWKEVIRLNKTPTADHITFDVPKYDEEDRKSSTHIMRWSTNASLAIAVETDFARMDAFERAVIGDPNHPNNDWYLIYKKLIVGKQIIGDLFSASLKQFQWEDLQGITFILSREAWDKYNANPFISGTRKVLKMPEKEYQGIGYFSPNEVVAMFEVAGIDAGLKPILQSFISNLNKIPKFK